MPRAGAGERASTESANPLDRLAEGSTTGGCTIALPSLQQQIGFIAPRVMDHRGARLRGFLHRGGRDRFQCGHAGERNFSAPTARPRMKARPTRWPVKVPGPVVTARRSSVRNRHRPMSSPHPPSAPAVRHGHAPLPRKYERRILSPSSTATEQAPSAVSTASSFTRDLAGFVEGEARHCAG